jgi:hypothetical protein
MMGAAMRRRMLISVSILAVLAIGVFALGWLLQPKPRIDQETLDKTKVGMTRSEVESIIGAPPGNYGVGEGTIEFWSGRRPLQHQEHKVWLGQKHAIRVWFDAEGKVYERDFVVVYREYDSSFDRILGFFGLKEKNQPYAIDF